MAPLQVRVVPCEGLEALLGGLGDVLKPLEPRNGLGDAGWRLTVKARRSSPGLATIHRIAAAPLQPSATLLVSPQSPSLLHSAPLTVLARVLELAVVRVQ